MMVVVMMMVTTTIPRLKKLKFLTDITQAL